MSKVVHIHLPVVDSTNSWIKKNKDVLDSNVITCVTASKQTAGRGRFERRWISPAEENLYTSFFFSYPKEKQEHLQFTQFFSLTLCSVLQKYGFHPEIKWPNDLLIHGKKIGGILCELLSLSPETYGVILGFGLNVNMPHKTAKTIEQEATSMFIEKGKQYFLGKLLEAIEKKFIHDLDLFCQKGFAAFREAYEAKLIYKGKSLTFVDNGYVFQGKYHSLSSDGRLNVQLRSGEIRPLASGEIRVKVSQ